jgi:orotidine-5'-phosphate decarboxylase
MLRAAGAAAGPDGPRVVGVTVLTSFDAAAISAVWGRPAVALSDEVLRLAAIVADAGLAGVVASPLEVADLKRRHGPDFLVVTPGIRPAGHGHDDQARVATPAAAVRAGADFLVLGRPVLQAPDPLAVIDGVLAELAAPVAS